MSSKKIRWESVASEHDYEAARSYLTLLFSKRDVAAILKSLQRAPISEFPAKDLLRASQTHLLDKDNPKVREVLKDLKKGKSISPVLIVRGDAKLGATLTIADGHHRICAAWHFHEKCPISCCLAELPPLSLTGRKGR
jgi:hypothetical protein